VIDAGRPGSAWWFRWLDGMRGNGDHKIDFESDVDPAGVAICE